jgi:hypothetical protein
LAPVVWPDQCQTPIILPRYYFFGKSTPQKRVKNGGVRYSCRPAVLSKSLPYFPRFILNVFEVMA